MYDQEPGLDWRKSRRCESGNCVEVAIDGDHVLMRDSTDPAGPRLRFDRSEWNEFLRGLRAQ
ncbi:DUF397 domain-containing protein [Rugosimonospora africana]|uniref:DUF397 domain-containing protein n=1 Tax=Rugosimonospora africana TaxID=556532 RepID=A0A8J3QV31_9ACTN|nr:DUF397 domain-containing protein [Rugosimonospora africana]GIH17026.1 hypothetical protein Raf01_51980 [Rugosimonospora africana]